MNKETVTLKIGEIKPNPKNEKIHTPENLNIIRVSLNEIGYVTLIIVDENNVILAGHGRYEVMRQDGWEEIEVHRLTGLTELQKKKFRLYDNQSSRTGFYDDELLTKTVAEILTIDIDFNIGILAFDGLIESFSDEIMSFDLPKAKMDKQLEKSRVLIVFPENENELINFLEAKKIQFIYGNHNNK